MGTNPALKIAGLICAVLFVFVIVHVLANYSGLLASRQVNSPGEGVPATGEIEETTTIEDDPEEQELPAPPSPVASNDTAPTPAGPSASPVVAPVTPPNTELTAQERAALERERIAQENTGNERPSGFGGRNGGDAPGGPGSRGDRRNPRGEMPTEPVAPPATAGPTGPVAPPATAGPSEPTTTDGPTEPVAPPATAGPTGSGPGRDQRDPRDQRRDPSSPSNTASTTPPVGVTTASTTPSTATASIPPDEKTISFKFTNTPWRNVISWLANESGFSLDMQSAPQGSFNYTDSRKFTPDEAIDLLNKYLLLREFSLVRVEKMLILLGPGQGVPPEFMQPITPEELDSKGEFELCCVLFQPKRTTTEDIQNEIEQMVRPPGSIVINPKSQTMRITERGGQLRAIRDIIKRLDDTGIGNLTLVKLENLSVDEAIGIVRQLLSIKEDDTSLRMVPDASGDKLFLSGRKDLVEQAKEAFEKIDSEFTRDTDVSEVRFGVYTIDTADPEVVFKVLQTRLAGTTKVRLSLDAYTSSIILQGPADAHEVAKSVIEEMQVNAMRIETLRLRRLNVNQAQSAVEKFFVANAGTQRATTQQTTGFQQGNRGNQQNQGNRNQPQQQTTASTSANAMVPTVAADAVNRQLIVKATSSQIAMIKKLLEEMGEPSFDGRDNRPGVSTGSMVRVVPVASAAQEIVLGQLRQSWGMMNSGQNQLYINESTTSPRSAPIQVWDSKEQGNASAPANNNNIRPRPANSPDSGESAPRDNEERIRQLLERRANSTRATDSKSAVNSAFRPVVFSREADEEEELVPINIPPVRREAPDDRGRRFEQERPLVQEFQSVRSNSPVVVNVGVDGSLILLSEDPVALDQMEDLLRTLSDPTILKETKKLIQYRLHYVKADAINSTLQTLMSSSSYSSSVTSSQNDEDNLLDSGPLGAILDTLNEGGNIRATGAITMTPITTGNRNILLIEANIVDHQTIQRLLSILDQPNTEDNPAILPSPRLVQFNNIRAESALERINEVFAENIGTSQQNAGNTRGGQQNPFMMGGPQMMGGGQQQFMNMMMGGRNTNQTQANILKMTLSLDTVSNSIIVNAPEELFTKVDTFCKQLDAAAVSIDEVTEIIRPRILDAQAIASGLQATSDNIVVSTGTSSSQSSNFNRNTTNQFGGAFGGMNFGGNTQRGGATFGGNTANRGGTMIGGGATRGTTGGMNFGGVRGGTTIGGGTRGGTTRGR